MKLRVLAAWSVAAVLGLLRAHAATTPIYLGDARTFSPPDPFPIIDARIWIQNADFSINNDEGFLAPPTSFEAQNNLIFTNTYLANINASPGFRFRLNQNGLRLPMKTFFNEGRIRGSLGSLFDGSLGGGTVIGGLSQLGPSLVDVWATNIINFGRITVGVEGLISLRGTNVNIKRSGLRAGVDPEFPVFGVIDTGSSNFYAAYGISDLWWGVGTNNLFTNFTPAMRIDGLGDFTYNLPCPTSPRHRVNEPGVTGLIFEQLPFVNRCFFSTNFPTAISNGYTASVYSNFISATSAVIQVVFYPTNGLDPNRFTEVGFSPTLQGDSQVVVGFHSRDYDILLERYVTNSMYLVDDLAFNNRPFYSVNQSTPQTRRPSTYDVLRSVSLFSTGVPGNIPYDPTLIYNTTYRSNFVRVVNTAYAADVSPVVSPPASVNFLSDSTNLPGRVDVFGRELNLDRTRIRADSALTVNTRNLSSNRLAQVDAPLVNFTAATVHPEMVISNLAPTTVRRTHGQIYCWSGIWDNVATNLFETNFLQFHVLFVDNTLVSDQPVTVDRLDLKAPSVKMYDYVRIGKLFRIDATNVSFASSGGVSSPRGYGLGKSNLVNLASLTNAGVIDISGLSNFGADRTDASGQPFRLNYLLNTGTNSASSMFIRSRTMENPGVTEARNGRLNIDTLIGRYMGGLTTYFTNITTNFVFVPPNFFEVLTNYTTNVFTNTFAAQLSATSDLEINARDFRASNSLFRAGRLVMAVTNNLTTHRGGLSQWITHNGFSMLIRPTNSSDLLGVELAALAPATLQEVNCVWAAQDRGKSSSAFSNNLALGRLILDGSALTLFNFRGAGSGRKAMYIDYLDLRNNTTNLTGDDRALNIDPKFTIYFANSSFSAEKITNAYPGRIIWATDYTGPRSATNLTYVRTNLMGRVTTNTYRFNIGLASSLDVDSDGDGMVNGVDPEPFRVPECVCMMITTVTVPRRQAIISWNGYSGTTNTVEFRTSLTSTNWQVVTNFPTGPIDRVLSVTNNLPATGQRYFRVRVNPTPYR